jgi:3-oxoacyl-[acyl-carrier protein] reductase
MGERLKDKVAIITGGGRGIGRAICLAFAKEGAQVVISEVDTEPANEVVKEIKGLGGKAIAIKADVRYKQETEELAKTAIDNFGKIDILVNNAGVTRDMAMFKMKDADWDDVVDVCLKGSFNCTQAVTNYMVPQARKAREEGKIPPARKIINVTSGAGVRGNPGQANYSAAKAGIMGLTKSNAKEFARHNILVNAICPVALTRITEGMKEDFERRIPLGRLGNPEKDIAPVVVFLASDDANYITGQVIPVNGGLDMAI